LSDIKSVVIFSIFVSFFQPGTNISMFRSDLWRYLYVFRKSLWTDHFLYSQTPIFAVWPRISRKR